MKYMIKSDNNFMIKIFASEFRESVKKRGERMDTTENIS
jgi:hypothetical protein